jgi:hypothetical protein
MIWTSIRGDCGRDGPIYVFASALIPPYVLIPGDYWKNGI